MDRIVELKSKVDKLYESRPESRADWADWMHKYHVFLVAREAEKLADRYGANKELAMAAAMLHDIADAVMKRNDPRHEEQSFLIARTFLKESGFSAEEIEVIVDDAIRLHSCYNNESPKSLEGKVMTTADAVVHLKSDFYDHAREEMSKIKTEKEIANWALPKIERDFNNKILFEDIQKELRSSYEKIRTKFSKNTADLI